MLSRLRLLFALSIMLAAPCLQATQEVYNLIVQGKHLEAIDHIDCGNVDPKFKDNNEKNLLHAFVLAPKESKKTSHELLRQLIQAGVDVNECDKYGTSPLCQAITFVNFEIAQKLLEYGANPNNSPQNPLKNPLDKAIDLFKNKNTPAEQRNIIALFITLLFSYTNPDEQNSVLPRLEGTFLKKLFSGETLKDCQQKAIINHKEIQLNQLHKKIAHTFGSNPVKALRSYQINGKIPTLLSTPKETRSLDELTASMVATTLTKIT